MSFPFSLVDVHCHLCAGLDDGPRSLADAVQMCRILQQQGVAAVAATAHQNDDWPDVKPASILNAVEQLQAELARHKIALEVVPNAEVMVAPDSAATLRDGQLLTVGNLGQHLLVEMPHGLYVDIRGVIEELVTAGVQPILAHPERCHDLLEVHGKIEELIACGCLVQVSTESVTSAKSPRRQQLLQDWFQRGVVHLIGSDGHSPNRRRPKLQDAVTRIIDWVGIPQATVICEENGRRILRGEKLTPQQPSPAVTKRSWLGWLRGR